MYLQLHIGLYKTIDAVIAVPTSMHPSIAFLFYAAMQGEVNLARPLWYYWCYQIVVGKYLLGQPTKEN